MRGCANVVCSQWTARGTRGVIGRLATLRAATEFVVARATKWRHRTAAPTVTETPSRPKSAPTLPAPVSRAYLVTLHWHLHAGLDM